MITEINRTKEINDSLREEGKVTILNRPQDIQAINILNKAMEEVRRDYKVKNQQSQISAAQTILNS